MTKKSVLMTLGSHLAMVKECEYKSKLLAEVMAERDALAADYADLAIDRDKLQTELFNTRKERDALAAKAAALDALIVAMQERATLYLQPNGEPDANFISYILTMLDGPEQRAAQADPVQYLAEIKAEAGRAGYVAGAEMWVDFGAEPEYKAGCLIGIEADADEYAAKVREGAV